jgi:adenosylhomocysteine nucleosidase
MKLLFVAADAMEFRGLLERAQDVRRYPIVADFSRSARIGAHDALLVANGAGWVRAGAAVRAAEGFGPDAIVSTGFCGALDDCLEIGGIVAGTEIAGAGRRYACTPLEAPHRGVVVSIDHVAQTAAEKRKLQQAGALAVEMEAAAVAAGAEEHGIPFYCIRAVTDLASENLENDFSGALRADGHFDTMFILRGALRSPSVRVPELLRLRSRCVRAARTLGDFIVGCRF